MRGFALAWASALTVAAAPAAAAVDPRNPSCPQNPDWGSLKPMQFSAVERDGRRILLAEGVVDDALLPRLKAALERHKPEEIWLRSAGGNARVGNEAGKLIRQTGIPTRVPAGWACFSACNFVFMGGVARFVDPGGLFIVHMFTHTSDRGRIEAELLRGTDNTVGLIGDIEQDSALLASEDNDFLIRMGVSRKLLTEVMYRQQAVAEQGDGSTRRCLTQEEAWKYNVANVR
ncbi:MAG TPA: hypothetical protein VEA61_11280 [Allosphingosinicella sp.]|nr:hypothetical protein [Allosphingosinicella sp.]